MFEIKELKKDKYIEIIYKMEKKNFADPWTKKMIKGEFNNKLAIIIGMINTSNKELVGYCFLFTLYDEIHINNIAIKKEHRRKGLGNRFIDYILNYAHENLYNRISLEVRESNKGAISLYTERGFTLIDTRKGYYTNPKEDALIFIKNLKEL